MRWLRHVNQVVQRPFVFYVHPWEIDPDQPRLKAGSHLSRWRHYVNLAETEDKLRRLLSDFRFGTLSEVVARNGEAMAQSKRHRTTEPAVSERQS